VKRTMHTQGTNRRWRCSALHQVPLWLMIVAIAIGGQSFPAPAYSAEIPPQLKEQVLQIIRENPEAILEAVQAYQRAQQEKAQQARQAALRQLATNPKQAIGTSPVAGSPKGQLILFEFSDFQCPYCAKAHETLKAFLAKHGDRVSLVYKHLPLTSIHAEAMPAAKAAWAAGQQGKFWEFHDALFTNQEQLGEPFYQATAKALGLDLAKFDRDRASQAAATAIARDMQLADALRIDGTPFFVVNGEAIPGVPELADLEAALNRAQP